MTAKRVFQFWWYHIIYSARGLKNAVATDQTLQRQPARSPGRFREPPDQPHGPPNPTHQRPPGPPAGSAPSSASSGRAPGPGRRPSAVNLEDTMTGTDVDTGMTAERLEELEFPQRLAILGDGCLLARNLENPEVLVWDLELATLQRMVIHDLQDRLVELVAHIQDEQWADKAAMDTAKALLEDYSTAIRNYDLMTEKKNTSLDLGNSDPFLITTCDRLGFNLFRDYGFFDNRLRRSDGMMPPEMYRTFIKHQDACGDGQNILPGISRTQTGKLNKNRRFLRRVVLGVLGGVAIIVPMLIMALANTLTTSLVVTCVATVLFAVALATPLVGGNLDEQTILGAVAAYAAILVVFVGTSLSVTAG